MAFTNGFKLIEVLENLRSDDIPHLLKASQLTYQKASILQWFEKLDSDAKIDFIHKAVQSYCHILSCTRLARAFLKVLSGLPICYQSIIEVEIKTLFSHIVSKASQCDSDLKMLCILIDTNETVKNSSRDLISSISYVIKERLINVHSPDKKLKNDFDATYHTLKICILCLQLNPEEIKHALQQSNINGDTNEELSCLWHTILSNLLTLLLEGSLARDLLFLVGTAAAMAVNLVSSLDEVVNIYVGVINMLVSDQTQLIIGNTTVHKPASPAKDDTLSLLSVIKGLLVCSPLNLLCHHVESQPVLSFLFPHLVSVCQGRSEHHYLAFQVFLLWFQKLETITTKALNNSIKPLHDLKDTSGQNSEIVHDIHRLDLNAKTMYHESKLSTGEMDKCDNSPDQTHAMSSSHDSFINTSPKEQDMSSKKLLSSNPERASESRTPFSSMVSKSPISSDFMSKSCKILSSTLSCLWLNWDSPVDGVSEYVLNIFQCLMKIWSQIVCEGLSDYPDLSLNLMNRVMQMAWHNKTRYRPMAVLLSHLKCRNVIISFPDLKDDLMRCMAMNHMAAVASDVYKIFLQKIEEECTASENQLSIWTDIWMDTLLFGITSSDSLQRLKTCTYWLPLTFKIIPKSADVLLEKISLMHDGEHISSRGKWLFAWMTVFKSARDLLNIDLPLTHDKYLQEALTSFDENIRSEVLMLICGTLKRAEPVLQSEIALLKSFLPVNLRTDSASFRQSLTSAIRKIIVRIRDSCLSMIRSRKTTEASLFSGIEFIEWLFKLLMHSLTPGGSYHRRQTTLNVIEAVLESLIHLPTECKKKGKAPENSDVLVRFAQERGMWDFFSNSNLSTLLMCLEDGAEEIQIQSYKVIVIYFPWPTSLMISSDILPNDTQKVSMADDSAPSILANDKMISHLFRKALGFVSSPKSYVNHSGQLIVCLLVRKFLEVLKIQFSFDDKIISDYKTLEISLKVLDERNGRDPTLLFVDSFLENVKTSLAEVQRDLAKQFKLHSIHGVTACITRCLEEVFTDSSKNTVGTEWITLLEDIVRVNENIVDLMLDVLAGGKSLDECPSFADVGIALKGLISSDLGDLDDQEEMATLSTDFQLLLSWCWINLKNSCSCLSEIVSCSVRGNICLLNPTVIKDIGKLYFKVLTSCRHRGALEGCRSGFSKFCSALLDSKKEELLSIPEKILEDILKSLSTNSLTASVSRRSAGLPIIIQTIVSNEIRIRSNKNALLVTVERLYEVASEPLLVDHSQQRDLAQSHALNILKVIFCEASLSTHLMPHLSKITILVIEGFDSPSWAIRNASTQLISTLVTRIFGQRKSEQGSMTLEEFHSAFPDLHDFAISRLQMYSASKSLINPSLYLILTLFSNLAMSTSHQNQHDIRCTLQESMLSFTSSPLYSLRKLSAQAYVSLCLLDCIDESVTLITERLAVDSHDLNTQHGYLLCLSYLVSTGFVSNAKTLHLLRYFSQNRYFCERLEECSITAAITMTILANLLNKVNDQLEECEASELWSRLTSHVLFLCKTLSSVQVGNNFAMSEAMRTLTTLTSMHKCLHGKTVQFLCSLLSTHAEDVQHEILLCLNSEEAKDYLEDSSIQQTLVENLSQEISTHVFSQSCFLLTRLQLQNCFNSQPLWQYSIVDLDIKETSTKFGNTNSVKSAVFLLEGIIIANTNVDQLYRRLPLMSSCCQRLLQFSHPCTNEDFRLSAARFLRVAGKKIVDYSCANNNSVVEEAVVAIIKSLLFLLQDAQSDVRSETAVFISEMNGSTSIHADLAMDVLSKIVSETLWWNSSLITSLLHVLLLPKELASALQKMSMTGEQRLFEPEIESALSEPYMLKFWTYRTMKDLLNNEKCSIAPFLTSVCSLAFTDLNDALPYIVANTRDNYFFNFTSDPCMLSALLGTILVDKLCSDANINIGSAACDLHSLTENLLQIPSIHPILKDVMRSS